MSNSNLSELLDELDMEAWADYEGLRFKLTRGVRGVQLNLRECPCCGNTKSKVYFGLETGLGNCFVCEEKFTKWKFIAAHLNVSNADVARYIENYMRNQGWRPRQTVSAPVDPKSLIIPDSIPIPIKGKNLKYLENRNISIEIAQFFHLRYCHIGHFQFKDVNGKLSYQDYAKRIIIPIFDMEGKMVSFQGRDITGLADKKYLFPPEFSATGSILYNGHNAFNSARVIVGEGVFDVFAIKAAIDTDPVLRECTPLASFGKKLGTEQLEKLKILQTAGKLKEVIFMWDAEKAAVESAVDAALECRKHGIYAKVALLPPGRDPNEVAPEVVREAIWAAETVTPLSAIKLKLLANSL